ncbi:MAG: acetate--CoA ligase [Alphaproteobacteria bacterium]|nr:acetate--CoA ligase [Alphaproteobacteria bacterium]
MRWPTLHKDSAADARHANLDDYERVRRSFTWTDARAALDGLPGGGLNIAYEAVDRHLVHGKAEKVALRWLGRDDSVRDITYGVLAAQSNRFANVLASLGVGKGDRVYSLLGRVPDLYIAALGTLKNGSVYSPLFSAFGPEPIKARMSIGDAKVLVTTEAFYKRKVAAWRKEVETLEHVLLIDRKDDSLAQTTICLADAMAAASPDFEIARTEPEDMALLHFTSGTTGRPKGAIHVHEAVVAHHATGRFALDLHEDDVFWCTADPGWVTGTSYGIVAPLTAGVTMIVDQADFDAERWYEILREQKVNVWYTAPTAIRMLIKLDSAATDKRELPQLRFIASVGEPLNPEAVMWGVDAFGLPIHDNWWQTETGGIMIANYRSMDVKPGSMGRPLPGIEAAIVRRKNGSVDVAAAPNTVGELALKTGWPSMMRGYLHEDERYRKCFAGDWYLTGDLAMRDEDGYFWFVGRDDDVIKSAGHLIGPFEVESALMEHTAVAEAAVIGKPDATVGEMVKAFVGLNDGYEPSEALRRELLGHARKRLGSAVAPKEIDFRANLPKTRSGKIMRRLLKARELGLPEGDLSTLESDEK